MNTPTILPPQTPTPTAPTVGPMSVLPKAPVAPLVSAPLPPTTAPITPPSSITPGRPVTTSQNSAFSGPTNQQVLALTHAIALQESKDPVTGKPNYNAVGDNGTSHGAYQWQPGNFAAAAKAAGLDPNDLSPENQDKVAYSQVKAMADEGLSPAQIASKWNSGSPNNFTDHSGTVVINGKPIHYDTPKYVQGVQGYYKQLIAGNTPTAPATDPVAPTTPTTAPANLPPSSPNLGQLDATQIEQGTAKIGDAITEGANKFAAENAQPDEATLPGELRKTGTLLETGLGAAAGVSQAVAAPATAVLQGTENAISDIPLVQKIAHSAPVSSLLDMISKGTGAIGAWAQQHPEAAKNLTDAVTVGGTALGDVGGEANPLNTDLAGIKEVPGQIKSSVSDILPPKTAPVEPVVKPTATDKFVRDLVTPIQTTGKSGTLVKNISAGRVSEGGLVSDRTIAPTANQQQIEDVVKTVPGIKKGQTALESANAIHDEIGKTAQDLRTQLSSRDVQPIVTQDSWDKYISGVKQNVAENPLITGDAQATADKIIAKFQTLLPAGKDITAEDILDARQGLDNWIRTIKGGAAFDPKTENAVSIALRATRQGANDLMAEAAPDVAVKQLLQRQSLLYDAIDNIAPKAAKEAGSKVGRILQTVDTLKKHPVASIGGAYVADKILKSTTGIGL